MIPWLLLLSVFLLIEKARAPPTKTTETTTSGCYFSEIRQGLLEKKETRYDIAKVSTTCGGKLHKMTQFAKEHPTGYLFGTKHELDLIAAPGEGNFLADWSDPKEIQIWGNRKICQNHIDELLENWDVRLRMDGHRQKLCNFPDKNHNVPLTPRTRHEVTKEEAYAYLKEYGYPIHPGTTVCLRHQKMFAAIRDKHFPSASVPAKRVHPPCSFSDFDDMYDNDDEMFEDFLSSLPSEILLQTFAFLANKELNAGRKVCKRLRNVINAHGKELYTSRKLSVKLCATSPAMIVDPDEYPVVMTRNRTINVKSRRAYGVYENVGTELLHLYFGIDNICLNVKAEFIEIWHKPPVEMRDLTLMLKDTFIGLSIADCCDVFDRSGQIHSLAMSGTPTNECLTRLQDTVDRAKTLMIGFCDFYYLSSVVCHKSLFARNRTVIIRGAKNFGYITDDRFYRDVLYTTIEATERQLLDLVSRKDITYLRINTIKVPKVACIREAIQVLLKSRMKFLIAFEDTNNEGVVNALSRTIKANQSQVKKMEIPSQ